VTAQDGSTKTYTVTVTVAANPNPGGGNPGQPNGGEGGGTPNDRGESVVSAGQSGEVSYLDEFKIVFPSGATDRDLRLKVAKLSETTRLFGQSDHPASSAFDATATPAGPFLRPVTVSMRFDPTRIKGDTKPAIAYYDDVRQRWIELGGTVSGNRITAESDRFGIFAVLAVGKSPVEEEPNEHGPTEPNASFRDIQGHWAEKSIRQAIGRKFVAGYSDGTFRPNQAVTRAEFAAMLVRALNLPNGTAALSFTDADRIGQWARDPIARAAKAGLIRGYSDGSFRPNAPISRAEMAVMIANALRGSASSADEPSFADRDSIPKWAEEAVARLTRLELMQGRSGNKFEPQTIATRAESVTVILRLLESRNE